MNSNDKQILFISLTDVPNGAENVLLTMALAVNGQMFFLKKNATSNLDIPNHILRTYLSHKSIFRGFLKLIPKLRKYKRDDIVMSTHPYLNAFLGFLKRIGYLRSKLVVRECTSVFTRFNGLKKSIYRLIYRIGYPAVNLIVCQTELMKAQLLDHNRFISPKKVLVQPNPVDFKKIVTKSTQPLVHSDSKLDFICSAGRLIPEKGFPILIRAFKIIQQQHPQLKLLLLGEGKDRELLSNIIKENNLTQAVILKGRVDNPVPYFKHAKLCVISSIKEGFPNVLLEMMVVNTSVVSTLCAGGISDIPSITKVKANDVNALADAIQVALSDKNHQNKQIVTEYLNKRTPEIFAQSILAALKNQN